MKNYSVSVCLNQIAKSHQAAQSKFVEENLT